MECGVWTESTSPNHTSAFWVIQNIHKCLQGTHSVQGPLSPGFR